MLREIGEYIFPTVTCKDCQDSLKKWRFIPSDAKKLEPLNFRAVPALLVFPPTLFFVPVGLIFSPTGQSSLFFAIAFRACVSVLMCWFRSSYCHCVTLCCVTVGLSCSAELVRESSSFCYQCAFPIMYFLKWEYEFHCFEFAIVSVDWSVDSLCERLFS